MMCRIRPLVCAVAVFAAAFYPDVAAACSCVPSPVPCGSLKGSTVFVGTVLSRSEASVEGPGPEARAGYAFEFAVGEAIAGITDPNVTVQTDTSTAACGYPFEVGETYLVYANRVSAGRYSASLCSRTRPLADASDDLVLLRQVAKGETGSRVFGGVVRQVLQVNGRFSDSDTLGGQPGIAVVASRGDFSVETTTDADGRFVFEDLAPGRYHIEPRWPRGIKSMFPVRELVTVGPCGAGDIFFFAATDAPLGGTVLGIDGAPVGKGVAVTIVKMDPADLRGARARERSTRAYTDERGRYEFDGLPSGQYLVGVNVLDPPSPSSPYPATYHPGGSDMARAVPVEVLGGQQLRIDLRLAPRLQTRRISGVVVDEHDAPVAKAHVTLTDAELPGRSDWTTGGTSDSSGHFDLEALEGRGYVLRVVTYGPERHAEFPVPRDGNIRGLRLRVLRP